jgi:LmbE family N-acetylglucosaminyl deacetylase
LFPVVSLSNSISNVLCLGAHCDDIEIGAAGTVMELLSRNPDVHVDWIVFSSTPTRAPEARQCGDLVLAQARSRTIEVLEFEERYFPYNGSEIKRYFDKLAEACSPDIVFTHFLYDRHQDHRILCEITWNTFRDHLICEYEIPKYEGDLGRPSLFSPLSKGSVERKIQVITDTFQSQHGKSWFSADVFRATMRLRGIESNAPSGYAEAFHCRKMLIS